jgi:4-hydroxybenzoate polyprenyltransferase
MLKSLLRLMRPKQWVKNGFVFTGLLFSNEYNNSALLPKVFLTFIAFCLISSCVYTFNDIYDCESDRLHSKKKFRPIPAGEVTVRQASILSVILGIAGLCIGFSVSLTVLALLAAYIVINILYTYWFKKVVILDVFCISAGFMLRIMAGTLGVGIPPSKWLLLCGMTVTLFLGFAKRRAELLIKAPERREVLQKYSPVILDQILAICATSSIITYSLYTMSAETIRIHQTDNLIYTVPFVIYALFRYIYLLHKHKQGEDPSQELFKDPHIMGAVAGWAILTFYLVSGHGF